MLSKYHTHDRIYTLHFYENRKFVTEQAEGGKFGIFRKSYNSLILNIYIFHHILSPHKKLPFRAVKAPFLLGKSVDIMMRKRRYCNVKALILHGKA